MLDRAKKNLELAGLFDSDSAYGGMIGPAVMKLMEIHCAEGHSGGSSSLVKELFCQIVEDAPLTAAYWDFTFEDMKELAKTQDGEWTEKMQVAAYGRRPKDTP
jgi:hypothetical protein